MQNWSDQPLTDNVASWYWGHGRVGPYSVVWFDFLGTDGTESVSAYVSSNNKIITSSCKAGSLKVRPTGPNTEYPPTQRSGVPQGFSIEIDLGKEGKLDLTATAKGTTLTNGNLYNGWIGTLSGSLNGGKPILGGAAKFEQFTLTP